MSVPPVAGPGFTDEASDGDDGVCEGDECVHDAGSHFGPDGQLCVASVVPGVGSLDDPSCAGLDGGGDFLGCDQPSSASNSRVRWES